MAIGIGKLKYEMLSDEELYGKPHTPSAKPLTEASTEPKSIKGAGLSTSLLNVDKFVQVNNLQPVTNPIFLDRSAPTPDGVLSYEIFGTSTEERKSRMAYIDLAPYHYMTPLAAIKLSGYDRTLSKVLYAQGRYKLVDGALVEDPEDGDSGPEFLYKIWGKVKVRDKDTITTKELQTFFEKPRSELFLTKFPVIPAFYRDLNTSGDGSNMKKSSSTLNSTYSSIIAYTQTLNQYTDTFTNMSRLTQARVQTLLVDVYQKLMIETVKGQPSKFGMLRRSLQGKNVNYSARLVISSPILQKSSYEEVQVKFGYVVLPLAYTISCFFPFIVHYMKRFFDSQFIQGGKFPVMDDSGKIVYTNFIESFDENQITSMITHYLNSPGDRFMPMRTPPDVNGKTYNYVYVGRFGKENTSVTRKATLTDILYIITCDAVKDKHVFVTRYPLDNYNGQFPAKIIVATTIKTQPATIGDQFYQFFPVCEGDPSNAFVDTLEFSNTMLEMMGGDYDGDQCSVRPVFTKEANEECERRIHSPAYILNIEGGYMRGISKDFSLCLYNLTRTYDNKVDFLKDCNATKPKYGL